MKNPSETIAELEKIHERTRKIAVSSAGSLGLMLIALTLVIGSVVFSVSQVAPLEKKIADRHAEIDKLDTMVVDLNKKIKGQMEALDAKQKELAAKKQEIDALNNLQNVTQTDLDRVASKVVPEAETAHVGKGWVWLGIYGIPGHRWLRGPFNDASKPPEEMVGETVTCSDRVYLRSDAPQPPAYALGKMVATIKEGTKVKILRVSKGNKSSWFAEIELSERSSLP